MIHVEHAPQDINAKRLTDKIRLSYDPVAERTRTREMIAQGVELGSIRHYLEQQSVKFVLEHILGVKKTTFEYEMQPDGLKYPGMIQPVRNMFAYSAELAGQSTREYSEFIGWNRIERMLYEHGARQIVQISPPSERNEFGNYGMLFHFERTESNSIRVSVNRYDDPTEKRFMTSSRALGSVLGLKFDPDRRERHYLENPVDITARREVYSNLLERMGISQQDRVSEDIEKLLLADSTFAYYLDLYFRYCLSTNQADPYWLLTRLSERAYVIGQRYERESGARQQIAAIPPIFDGSGCLVIPGMMPIPRYLGNGERVVTQCPHCHTRLLLGREHELKGIRCTCNATVPAGNPSKCIIEASRPADFYQQMTLLDAGFSNEKETALAAETTE